MFYFQYGSIILTRLWAPIGVTRSYSSHPFLCTLDALIAYYGTVLIELCHFADSHWGKGFPGPEGILQSALARALQGLDDLFVAQVFIRPLGKTKDLPQCYTK